MIENFFSILGAERETIYEETIIENAVLVNSSSSGAIMTAQ